MVWKREKDIKRDREHIKSFKIIILVFECNCVWQEHNREKKIILDLRVDTRGNNSKVLLRADTYFRAYFPLPNYTHQGGKRRKEQMQRMGGFTEKSKENKNKGKWISALCRACRKIGGNTFRKPRQEQKNSLWATQENRSRKVVDDILGKNKAALHFILRWKQITGWPSQDQRPCFLWWGY